MAVSVCQNHFPLDPVITPQEGGNAAAFTGRRYRSLPIAKAVHLKAAVFQKETPCRFKSLFLRVCGRRTVHTSAANTLNQELPQGWAFP
ncbi:MAG: hypothetical protein AAFU58_04140, partial [Pseudomonadota bacterium]